MKKYVFVIDDEEEVAMAMKHALEFIADEVWTFKTCEEFINNFIKEHKKEDSASSDDERIICILDDAAAGEIKDFRLIVGEATVIFYTSYRIPGRAELELMSASRMNYLKKPVLPNDIIQRIEDIN